MLFSSVEGPIDIVRKDRRGELFYYMHSQLVARYEAERISNEMPRTVTYDNWREPVKEGYYSKLLRNTNMRPYPGRPPNTTLKDLNRPEEDLVVTLTDMENWLANILVAIDQGVIIAVSLLKKNRPSLSTGFYAFHFSWRVCMKNEPTQKPRHT